MPTAPDPIDPGWRIVSDDGKIVTRLDFEHEDYYLDAEFDYDQAQMNSMVRHLDLLGLEIMTFEECEPDIYDTHTRVYIARKYQRDRPLSESWRYTLDTWFSLEEVAA